MNSADRNMNINGRKPGASAPSESDAPLQIEPDGEDERPAYGWTWGPTMTDRIDDHQPAQTDPDIEEREQSLRGHVNGAAATNAGNDHPAAPHSDMGCEAGHMSDVLRWALDSMHEPALAAADWLARDIDPDQPTATALLTNPEVTLAQVKQAKTVFKTMRIVGEKSADRRVGARMYAAAIAAGLVRHQQLISSQSDEALKRAFQGLLDDRRMPSQLRDLAGMALCALAEGKFQRAARPKGRASPGDSMSMGMSPFPMPGPNDARSMPRPQARRKRA